MCSRGCNYGGLCHHKHITLFWLRGGSRFNGDKNKSIIQQSAGLHYSVVLLVKDLGKQPTDVVIVPGI